jgi:phosphate transport system protein
MSHFEERLEADLESIRDWVWKIGSKVENSLLDAKRSLLTRDDELGYATVLGDNPINRDSRTCDRMCHTFIARHLPGAGHLREMAATIRVNVALERVGDYAVTISREGIQLDKDLPEKFVIQIDGLADESIQILHESRRAFRDGNADVARTLMQVAKRVEAKMDAIYDALFEQENELTARMSLSIFVIFSLLKRVADQAKNICDQTVYSVRGVAKIPKVYHILFMDDSGLGAGQLATAIGRKNFPTSATFDVATPGDSQILAESLRSFMTETGLSDQDLKTENLGHLQHDLSNYHVIIGLGGKVQDSIEKVPFHTSVLNWEATSRGTDSDYPEMYRFFRSEITDLIDLLAGEEAV